MNYTGKLYGKIGNKYFDTSKTSNDFDELVELLKDSLSHIADLKLGNSAPFPLRSFEDDVREVMKKHKL